VAVAVEAGEALVVAPGATSADLLREWELTGGWATLQSVQKVALIEVWLRLRKSL